MSVDVVIVAYDSEATIAAAIRSVIDDPVVDQVVVVDNRSPDDSAGVAEKAGAFVVGNEVNSGFGAGCNLGAGKGRAEWILFLNPDASMAGGSVAGMAAYASAHPEVGVVASAVRGASGEPEPVRRRFPVWWRAFAEPGVAAKWDERYYGRRQGHAGGAVDWVSASATLVRRAAFDAVGGFDETFFLYAEEIDLCARLGKAGFAAHWIPGFPSTHNPGTSTGRLPAAGKEEWARGFSRYVAKHSSRPALMRAGLLVGLWGRAAMWALRRRPDNYRKWVATARVIRAGGTR